MDQKHPVTMPEEAPGVGPGQRAARAVEAPDEASYRLDKRTYLDKEQGSYRANLIDYGGGLCEVGWSFVSIRPPKPSIRRGQSETREENEQRAARRAKSAIRKKVLSFGLDHLLTLTYRDNVTDFDQASADLARFLRLVKGQTPNFPYVAVPDKQARGAWPSKVARTFTCCVNSGAKPSGRATSMCSNPGEGRTGAWRW